MRIRLFVTLGASVFAILLAQSGKSQTTPAAPAATATDPQLQQHFPRYKIHNEDTLLLSFPLSPEFNQSVTVQPDGFINLHAAPSLHIEGMTVPELVAALKNDYAGTLHAPIIDVDLQDYQRPKFTVSGQVGKPGQYELREDITVSQAIALAGGLSPTAKSQVFVLHRTSADWYQVQKFNVNDILKGKKFNEDLHIREGDMVYVPETFITKFRKYVPYSLGTGTYFNSF